MAFAGCGAADDEPAVVEGTPDGAVVQDGSDAAGPDTATPPSLEDNFGVTESEGDAQCEGLSSEHCLLPFPSDRYRVVDAEGIARLIFDEGALPEQSTGQVMDKMLLAGHDGWSAVTPILMRMPGATLAGTASVSDIARSLEPDSPTVLLDADTGERVAHWLEEDHFTVAGDKPVLTIRAAARLDWGRRYIVAVRGLVGSDGEALPAEAGFAALRDQTASTVRGIHTRREHFEAQVFTALTEAGVERADLQLAFDFTTASQDPTTRILRSMREQALAAMPDGPAYVVDSIDSPQGEPNIARIIRVTVQVPSFLLPSATGARRLRLDDDGLPVADGTEAVPFVIQVPHSVVDSGQPAPVLQYGHGLFGSHTEANNGWLRSMANRLGFVIVACDMAGLSELDIEVWGVELTSDVSAFAWLWEKPMQGLINHVGIARLVATKLPAELPDLDGSRLYYYGNSQGGTMGTVLMALHSDVERGVLGVPGAAYAFLLNRSTAFSQFAAILTIPFPDPVDFATAFGIMQTGFNRLEPLSYIDHIAADPLPGAPTHRVLLHVAKEDSQVVNDVSFLLARSLGVVNMSPAVRPVFGLAEQAYPYDSDAMVEYDFGKPDNPKPTEPPPAEHDTHGDLRKLEVAQDQLWHFLETGEVKSFCDGPCDPE